MDRSLVDLLAFIDKAIRKANEATSVSGTVYDDFAVTHHQVRRAREQVPFWRRVTDMRSFKARQLQRDFEIAKESFQSVANLRSGLEAARMNLIQYRDNAGLFKVLAFTKACSLVY